MVNLKSNFYLSLIIVFFILSSCKNKPEPVPNIYEVFLEFQDEKGLNLLDDFDENNFKTDIIIKTAKGEILEGDYFIVGKTERKVLKILSSTLPENRVNVVTYTIQNEELMGSAEEHILETKWSYSNNNTFLDELSINGTIVPSIKEDYFNYYVLTKKSSRK